MKILKENATKIKWVGIGLLAIVAVILMLIPKKGSLQRQRERQRSGEMG